MSVNLEILYRDEALVAVSKPAGLFVHHSEQDPKAPALLQNLRNQIKQYVYPLHRLDRPASGIVLFALESEMAKRCQAIWHQQDFEKYYLALVKGRTPALFSSDRPLSDPVTKESKPCLSHFETLENFSNTSLLRIKIETGRYHQIRRHLAHLGHQIIGDTTYGKGRINQEARLKGLKNRLFLHATQLKFSHPLTQKMITIKSPLPNELEQYLEVERGTRVFI